MIIKDFMQEKILPLIDVFLGTNNPNSQPIKYKIDSNTLYSTGVWEKDNMVYFNINPKFVNDLYEKLNKTKTKEELLFYITNNVLCHYLFNHHRKELNAKRIENFNNELYNLSCDLEVNEKLDLFFGSRYQNIEPGDYYQTQLYKNVKKSKRLCSWIDYYRTIEKLFPPSGGGSSNSPNNSNSQDNNQKNNQEQQQNNQDQSDNSDNNNYNDNSDNIQQYIVESNSSENTDTSNEFKNEYDFKEQKPKCASSVRRSQDSLLLKNYVSIKRHAEDIIKFFNDVIDEKTRELTYNMGYKYVADYKRLNNRRDENEFLLPGLSQAVINNNLHGQNKGIIILVDFSGSTYNINGLLNDFCKQLRKNTEDIYAYNTKIFKYEFTEDSEQGFVSNGGTSIYRALLYCNNEEREKFKRNYIYILTDGEDDYTRLIQEYDFSIFKYMGNNLEFTKYRNGKLLKQVKHIIL